MLIFSKSHGLARDCKHGAVRFSSCPLARGIIDAFEIGRLVMFTRDRAKMGALVSLSWLTFASAVIAGTIIGLNAKMVYDLALG